MQRRLLLAPVLIAIGTFPLSSAHQPEDPSSHSLRERISINDNWAFMKYAQETTPDDLIYDVRPEMEGEEVVREADAEPTKAEDLDRSRFVLKPWILPSGNAFIADPEKRHIRPEGHPGQDFPFVQLDFDDSGWEQINLPHDWAIAGPFNDGSAIHGTGGGMGRLPSPGVAWYRKSIDIPASDANRRVYLEVDGAMSYAMVWLNGYLVGGWPFGYSSWHLDLTPYLHFGAANQLAIRLDNPPFSSRWYPGGGIYRNVWLTKTGPLHVDQWGTFVTTPAVSDQRAEVHIEVQLVNHDEHPREIELRTAIHERDARGQLSTVPVAWANSLHATIPAKGTKTLSATAEVSQPRLWGPPPTQEPNLYVAVTEILHGGVVIDRYKTRFGIRTLEFKPESGIYVNGERIRIQGINQHHDLGALGAAFNTRAAERQLEMLREVGANAIRLAHNPPAPELLELTDRMGFLVVNETFDVWERRKTPMDFHLIFPEWGEQDTRALVHRDRNSPSVIMWSFGNEVGEQYTDEEGAAVARRLHDIIREEDPTRPTTASMNFAKPDMPFPRTMDVISLNYQGTGIRDTPAHAHLVGIRTPPLYAAFHEAFPDKVILSSESAATISARGVYNFPVFDGITAPIYDGQGGDSERQLVCSYELYTANFGSSPDRVFAAQDRHPFVAGEFVWSGWDYIGEPTPYYDSRSASYGMIDLAGFPKNRFFLYQSRWRPDLPMVHILPHWTWPEREGEITPVHVFTSGDEAELFLNGRSLGRKQKGPYVYRLRWDEVIYEPGKLEVIAYRNGEEWARAEMITAGDPAKMEIRADRNKIRADGKDLSFLTIRIVDQKGNLAPRADQLIEFSVEGPAEIIATDNGDPTDFTPFPSHQRSAFNGYVLAIVRSLPDQDGEIIITASHPELGSVTQSVRSALSPGKRCGN